VRPAELEGAHALQVLALEECPAPRERVELARGRHGRSVGDARQPRGGGLDVRVGDRGRRGVVVHSRLILSSKVTDRSVPPSVSVIFTGRLSMPFSFPVLMPCSTAASISRCECTPTIFRNFRMLMLNASGFMAGLLRRP